MKLRAYDAQNAEGSMTDLPIHQRVQEICEKYDLMLFSEPKLRRRMITQYSIMYIQAQKDLMREWRIKKNVSSITEEGAL
jgi:hypothetical protein